MKRMPGKMKVLLVLVLAGVLPVVIATAAQQLLGPGQFPNEMVHDALEVAGTCIALGVALLLFVRLRFERSDAHLLWVIAALIVMGILDGAHAVLALGVSWSWLRHVSTLLGGLGFGLIWIPVSLRVVQRKTAIVAGVCAFVVGLCFVLSIPSLLPTPWVGDPEHHYTLLVRLINVAGGLGFVSAAVFFIRRFVAWSRAEDLVFASQTVLFATAGLLFGMSHLWSPDWWVWHLARLAAYGVVLVTVYQTVVGLYRGVEQNKAELERRVQLRTAELQKSEATLKQAVRIAGLGSFDHDHITGRIEYSPLMRNLLGVSPDEQVTLETFFSRIDPDDRPRIQEAVKRAHAPSGNGQFAVEYRVPQPGGEVRWVSARSETFFQGEGVERRAVRTIGVCLEVTDQKLAEQKLERLVTERTAKLQEVVGELEHFSYTITHDMRSPLRAMQGFAEILMETPTDRPGPEWRTFLQRIRTSAERMDALIRDALSYSKAVRQELPLDPVDLGALLRGMLDSYPEFQPSRARIDFKNEIPPVMGNQAALTQCFSNLLGNSVKFVEPGRTPEVTVWAETRDPWVRIWVEDNGIGISESMKPRLFQMFARGDKNYEGTGIGLALVRKVVERMGGVTGAESKEGRGSRFWVELKLAK